MKKDDLIQNLDRANGDSDCESVYDYAAENGYPGTEAEFQEALATFDTKVTQSPDSYAGVLCSSLGMIADDENEASNNYTLLLNELKKGSKILVDGAYYIKSPYGTTAVSNTVTYDISIAGNDTEKCKLILMGGCFFFAQKNVTITGISLIGGIDDATQYFLYFRTPFIIDNINISNNYISGNMRLITTNVSVSYNFETSGDCMIKNLYICNNVFFDIWCCSTNGNNVVIALANVPVVLAFIKNNNIRNFSLTFYNNSIINGTSSSSSQYIYDHQKNIFIENNTVINDDDYDAISRHTGYRTSYFCLTVLEASSAVCRNNRFEGIRVHNEPNIVVYDNYFSVTHLLYENNVWKNNVNFTAGIINIDLMKAKGGAHGTKIFRGNTYIVEPEYADKFGEDRFLLRKSIDQYQSWQDNVIIDNNYFDVYLLYYSPKRRIRNYTFTNNVVNTYTVDTKTGRGYAFITMNLYRNIDEKPYLDENGNILIQPRRLVFMNNVITCQNAPVDDLPTAIPTAIVANNTNNGTAEEFDVIFENNYIKTYNLDYILHGGSNPSTPCKANLKFNNNTIVNHSTKSAYTVTNFDNLWRFSNNNFEAHLPNNKFFSFHRLPLCADLKLTFDYTGNDLIRLFGLSSLYPDNYQVFMKTQANNDNAYEEFDSNFIIKNNGKYNVVDCVGKNVKEKETAYTQQDYVVDGSGNRYVNFLIQKENKKGSNVAILNIANTSAIKEIFLSGVDTTGHTGKKFNGAKITLTLTIIKI